MTSSLFAWHRGKLVLIEVGAVLFALLAVRDAYTGPWGLYLALMLVMEALASTICLLEFRRRLRARSAGYLKCPHCGEVLKRVPLTVFAWCPACQRHYEVERKR